MKVKIVEEIIAVEIPDGVHFTITKVTDIMEEHDYPGIRFMLETSLDNLRQAIKIDISTGDIITPGAVEYSYKLMFEDRSISLWTYNLETLLAEKLETMFQHVGLYLLFAYYAGDARIRCFDDREQSCASAA